MISSPLMMEDYRRLVPDYEQHGRSVMLGELVGVT
jgi:hypothetical protein